MVLSFVVRFGTAFGSMGSRASYGIGRGDALSKSTWYRAAHHLIILFQLPRSAMTL